MALQFCANLSFMFQETPTLLARYEVAKRAGFKAVECAFPYDIPLQELVPAKEAAGVEQVLINAPPGDWSKGDRGLAAIPGRESEFKASIVTAFKYAKALKCNRVHVMAGAVATETPENLSLYVENLRIAAKVFEENNIIGLIEPINKYALPNYFLNSYDRAVAALVQVNSTNLKLQLDLFHLQHMSGNLTRMIQSVLPYVGHIQIAQVPDRHEPDSSGEVDYKYIFALLDRIGYEGWIGLEYTPAATTEAGLGWINSMGFSL